MSHAESKTQDWLAETLRRCDEADEFPERLLDPETFFNSVQAKIAQLKAHQDWMDRETAAAIARIDAGEELIPHHEVMERMIKRQKARSS